MADTNTTDVRTMTAAEAAEDAELWRQVERGEAEVTFVDGNNTWHVTYAVIHTGDWLLHSFHQWVNLFYEEGETSHNLETPLTVRRVQPAPPAGDDGRETSEAQGSPLPQAARDDIRADYERYRSVNPTTAQSYAYWLEGWLLLERQALKSSQAAFDEIVSENATLCAQLAEANARAEKAEAMLVQRSDFWSHEHIEQFMEVVRNKLPNGTQVVVSHGYDELKGKVGTVLGAMHFIEQAAAKVSVDFGDGTEYVPSNLLRVVTSTDSEHDSAQEAK